MLSRGLRFHNCPWDIQEISYNKNCICFPLLSIIKQYIYIKNEKSGPVKGTFERRMDISCQSHHGHGAYIKQSRSLALGSTANTEYSSLLSRFYCISWDGPKINLRSSLSIYTMMVKGSCIHHFLQPSDFHGKILTCLLIKISKVRDLIFQNYASWNHQSIFSLFDDSTTRNVR